MEHAQLLLRQMLTDTDLLLKNVLKDNTFKYAKLNKPNYPVMNVYLDKDYETFNIKIVAPEVEKDDILVELRDDSVRVAYDRPKDEEEVVHVVNPGIAKRSYDLTFKIPYYEYLEFTEDKIDISLKKGVLKISIPVKEECQPKKPVKLKIK